jgi:glycosyltransferase involved in cell wall biosynthesis
MPADRHDLTPRLVQVITRLNIGGPARYALLVAEKVSEHGFHSELVYGAEAAREGSFEPLKVPHRRLPTLKRVIDPVSDARALQTLTAFFRERRPWIVHTHMAKAGALGRIAARRASVPVVLHTFHGHVLDGYFPRPLSAMFAATERRLAKRTDALIAVSPMVRDELLAHGIGSPDQWHVIPLGQDLDHLLAETPSTDAARRSLGLPADRPLVGIVGRLVAIKDHSTFLKAAARVAQRRPDVFFVVAGDGRLRPQLETRARAMLGDRIRFLGWVSDLASLYEALDVVVLTSRNEGTPVTLIEAGAAGTAIVATRVGGVPDVVADGVTGLLAPAGDPSAIALHIQRFLDDPDWAAAVGATAREQARQRFSASWFMRDTIELYTELLARRDIALPG